MKSKIRRRAFRFGRRRATLRFWIIVPALVIAIAVSGGLLIHWTMDSLQLKRIASEDAALYESIEDAHALPTQKPRENKGPIDIIFPEQMPFRKNIQAFAEKYHDLSGEIPDRVRELQRKYRHLAGWVQIKDVTSRPVFFSGDDFYLNHDRNGKEYEFGEVYISPETPLEETSQLTVLYGHNVYDGSIFGVVSHYKRSKFSRRNLFAEFSTLWQKEEYVLFASAKAPAKGADVFDITPGARFENYAAFDRWIDQFRKHAVFISGIDVKASDPILVLVTCSDSEERVIVGFRKIRENETREALRAIALSQ